MKKILEHPDELEWLEGSLPPVDSVPYNCCLLAWLVHDTPEEDYLKSPQFCAHPKHNGSLYRIGTVRPWKDDLNSLRWVDSSGFGIGHHEKVKYYAWLVKGDD